MTVLIKNIAGGLQKQREELEIMVKLDIHIMDKILDRNYFSEL